MHSSDVPHHRFCRHGTEGDDLRNCIAPVALGDVINHAVASVYAKVDIKVGHRDPLRIQEALKQQLILKWIKIGDREAIGNQRPRTRSASGTNRDVILLSPLDKIHDDQKVAREAHVTDDLKLKVHAFGVFAIDLIPVIAALSYGVGKLKPSVQSLVGDVAQKTLKGCALWDWKIRQVVFTDLNRHAAAARQLQRIFNHSGDIAEQLLHLGLSFKVLIFAVIPRPSLIGQHAPA